MDYFASMAVLPIVQFPDPRLRQRASQMSAKALASTECVRLIDDMFETMYAAAGIGLAATQVDVHQCLIVIDVSEDKTSPRVFINPRVCSQDDSQVYREGCLSIPGIYAEVTRAKTITVQYLDRQGKSQVLQADGLLSVCIQHEIDHLNGRLFIDSLSPLKREMIRKKLAKNRHPAA